MAMKYNTGYEFFLSDKFLPLEFEYPETYKDFIEVGSLDELDPWRFYCGKVKGKFDNLSHLEFHFKGLQDRYPDRFLIPFSSLIGDDDVACFDASVHTDDPPVLIIHDFASPGWEYRGKYKNFSAWLEAAKLDARRWEHYQKYGN